jgi:hypothetical protein
MSFAGVLKLLSSRRTVCFALISLAGLVSGCECIGQRFDAPTTSIVPNVVDEDGLEHAVYAALSTVGEARAFPATLNNGTAGMDVQDKSGHYASVLFDRQAMTISILWTDADSADYALKLKATISQFSIDRFGIGLEFRQGPCVKNGLGP